MNLSALQTYRSVGLSFSIDTNRINAKGKDPAMNQLSQWREKGVIQIEIPQAAYKECIVGSLNWGDHAHVTASEKRAHEASSYTIALTDASSTTNPPRKLQEILVGLGRETQEIGEQVERILFPRGAKTPNQRNDVRIVSCAACYETLLITNDGGSKSQPGGILGNRGKLKELRIFVMTADEAVELVKKEISRRDEQAKLVSKNCGLPLPEWVGRD